MPPEEPILPDLCRRNLTEFTYAVVYRMNDTGAIVNWMWIRPEEVEIHKTNCIRMYNHPTKHQVYFGNTRVYFVAKLYYYHEDLTDKKEE